MAPNPNGMIAKSSDDSDGSSLVNRSKKIIVSKLLVMKAKEVHKYLQKDRPNARPYDTKPGEKPYELEIVWRNVLAFIYLHGAALYAFHYTPQTSTILIGTSIDQR